MSTSPSAYPLPVPVAELERRLNWRVFSIAGFGVMLAVLAGMAAMSQFTPPRNLSGLPADPDLDVARAWMRGRTLPAHGPLRWSATILGEGAATGVFAPATRERAREAARAVARARTRLGDEPRTRAALAALALVDGDLRAAERHYRAALDRNPHYGEARLGLGVTLALRAPLAPGVLRPRALELAAIAQFAAVAPHDPLAPLAMWNRAVLLREVGRSEESRRIADAYRQRDPSSAWAAALTEGASAR